MCCLNTGRRGKYGKIFACKAAVVLGQTNGVVESPVLEALGTEWIGEHLPVLVLQAFHLLRMRWDWGR